MSGTLTFDKVVVPGLITEIEMNEDFKEIRVLVWIYSIRQTQP